jgi:hypothetical protein
MRRYEPSGRDASAARGSSFLALADAYPREETRRERPAEARGNTVSRVRDADVGEACEREYQTLARWTTKAPCAGWIHRQTLADGAVLARRECARCAHRTFHRLFVGGLGMIPATVDARVGSGSIGARDIANELIVPKTGLFERYDQLP